MSCIATQKYELCHEKILDILQDDSLSDESGTAAEARFLFGYDRDVRTSFIYKKTKTITTMVGIDMDGSNRARAQEVNGTEQSDAK